MEGVPSTSPATPPITISGQGEPTTIGPTVTAPRLTMPSPAALAIFAAVRIKPAVSRPAVVLRSAERNDHTRVATRIA